MSASAVVHPPSADTPTDTTLKGLVQAASAELGNARPDVAIALAYGVASLLSSYTGGAAGASDSSRQATQDALAALVATSLNSNVADRGVFQSAAAAAASIASPSAGQLSPSAQTDVLAVLSKVSTAGSALIGNATATSVLSGLSGVAAAVAVPTTASAAAVSQASVLQVAGALATSLAQGQTVPGEVGIALGSKNLQARRSSLFFVPFLLSGRRHACCCSRPCQWSGMELKWSSPVEAHPCFPPSEIVPIP